MDIIPIDPKEGSNQFYRLINLYQEYMSIKRDYGDGTPRSMVEVHILQIICKNPGITVNGIAKLWHCTKGAASQNITKLTKKGLVERRKSDTDGRSVYLYATKSGMELNEMHENYDKYKIEIISDLLLEKCSMEELEEFYKIMVLYCDLLENQIDTIQNK